MTQHALAPSDPVALCTSPPAALEMREYRPGDEISIVSTFNLVFGAEGSGTPPRTPEEWRWEFLENPGGWRIWLALCDGEVVAQSAGLGHRALVDGRECSFAQTVDAMVHPGHRSGLKRPGLFVRTAMGYVEAYGGRKDLIFFGWPSAQLRRIGRAFLGYRTLREESLLVRELGSGEWCPPMEVERATGFDRTVGPLFERCASDWGASIVRDERFLNWRFRDHPSFRYDVFNVRDSAGLLQGYAVARAAGWPLPGLYVVGDWLVPASDREAGELLLRAVCARASALSAAAVVALFPEWSPWHERFRRAGFHTRPTGHELVVRVHHCDPDLEWLRERWWYQLAESDLV